MKRISLWRFLSELRHPELRGLFGTETHLTDREKLTLYRLARKVSRNSRGTIAFVEIGSYLGASACFLAAAAFGVAGKVYCVDTWNNDAMTEGSRDTMAEFLRNTQQFAGKIVPIRGWSTDQRVIDRISREAGEIDLLFIDGDHSYAGVLADWTTYSPLLAKHAVVAVHDIGWAVGVQRVVFEEIRPRIFREARLPNLWWGWLGP